MSFYLMILGTNKFSLDLLKIYGRGWFLWSDRIFYFSIFNF